MGDDKLRGLYRFSSPLSEPKFFRQFRSRRHDLSKLAMILRTDLVVLEFWRRGRWDQSFELDLDLSQPPPSKQRFVKVM